MYTNLNVYSYNDYTFCWNCVFQILLSNYYNNQISKNDMNTKNMVNVSNCL